MLGILWPELGTYVHVCMRASKGTSGPELGIPCGCLDPCPGSVCGFLLCLPLLESEPMATWQSEGLQAGSEIMSNQALEYVSAAGAWKTC